VTISGQLGDDAKPYQEREVRQKIKERIVIFVYRKFTSVFLKKNVIVQVMSDS
jgi:hypothetical protein